MGVAIVGALNFDQSLGELERGLHGIVETPAIFWAHHEPVDDHRDVVIHPPIELGRLGDLDELAIDYGADEALLAGGLEQLAELAFATAHQRSQHLDLRAFRPGEDRVGDLSGALALDSAAAVGAVRSSRPGVEESEVVVDFCDGSDRGARVMARALLLDGDGGRESLYGIHVRLFHEAEELARVGGE